MDCASPRALSAAASRPRCPHRHMGTRARRGKENIIRQLKRLHGGETGAIKAMRDRRGKVYTEPARMVQLMQEHWEEVFTCRGINRELLTSWLEDVYPPATAHEQERKRDADGVGAWRGGLPPGPAGGARH